ncbi:MAG: SpoIIIAC/SpoIIIAD family protein [Ruminococcus sp.]|nr:SpoIIIAC/SpoIIIAD family protein [Ruminococcus sp.]
MNILSLGALAVTAVTAMLFLKPKNGEIALMLGIAASAVILLSLLGNAGTVIRQINQIVSAANVNASYLVIMLKVVGICIVTEFTVNTCRDAGSSALAGNVSLAGKLLVTVTALPLYTDILNTVSGMLHQ